MVRVWNVGLNGFKGFCLGFRISWFRSLFKRTVFVVNIGILRNEMLGDCAGCLVSLTPKSWIVSWCSKGSVGILRTGTEPLYGITFEIPTHSGPYPKPYMCGLITTRINLHHAINR